MEEREFCEYCLGLADYIRRIIPESELTRFMSKQEIKTSEEKHAKALATGIEFFLYSCSRDNTLPKQDFKLSAKIIHFPVRIYRKRKREELRAMCKGELTT